MTGDELEEHNSILMEGPSDPDAQAAVTDFIDYTEYLPSDLVRSLTLIRGLDETYLNASSAVHELTRTYGSLPSLPPESRPEASTLRKQISEQLSRGINARESAYAESCRLYDAVDRHFDRLGSIKSKLDTLLNNFADDTAGKSAAAGALSEGKQSADDRKASERAAAPKITLRFDTARHRGEVEDGIGQQKEKKGRGGSRADRSRKSAFGADTAVASTEQPGAEDEGATAAVAATHKKKGTAKKGQKNRPVSRQPGASTSAAPPAGLESSTSNALATLQPPPPDAQQGSEHMPWLRLTEWEMARLRKKMKKNNFWQPSEIMINRELDIRGRGWEGYRLAKANAELTGNEVIDCDDIEKNYVPEKLVRKDEAATEGPEVDKTKLSNRGMKLNEAKKQKRENLAQQAAVAAAEAEMAARRLGDIGSTFKSLFSSPAEQSPFNCVQNGSFASSSPSNANGIAPKDRTKAKPNSKKRKLEEAAAAAAVDDNQQQQQQNAETPTAAVSAPAKPGSKRSKLSQASVDGAAEIPPVEATAATPITKAAPTATGPSGSKKTSPVSSAIIETKRTTRRSSIASAKAKPTPTPPRTARSLSRRPSNAALSGGPAGRELRKKSATPATTRVSQSEQQQPATTVPGLTTTTTRRGRRPAPGPVTAGQDGGAAVSVGRRKAKPAPRKKKEPGQRAESQPSKEDVRVDEDGVLEEIDPNEPRYCMCGDVSFGTMICCEDNDVSLSLQSVLFPWLLNFVAFKTSLPLILLKRFDMH